MKVVSLDPREFGTVAEVVEAFVRHAREVCGLSRANARHMRRALAAGVQEAMATTGVPLREVQVRAESHYWGHLAWVVFVPGERPPGAPVGAAGATLH